MLTQIVEYILVQDWSPGMTLTEKLFEAIVHGSMAKDYHGSLLDLSGLGRCSIWAGGAGLRWRPPDGP